MVFFSLLAFKFVISRFHFWLTSSLDKLLITSKLNLALGEKSSELDVKQDIKSRSGQRFLSLDTVLIIILLIWTYESYLCSTESSKSCINRSI